MENKTRAIGGGKEVTKEVSRPRKRSERAVSPQKSRISNDNGGMGGPGGKGENAYHETHHLTDDVIGWVKGKRVELELDSEQEAANFMEDMKWFARGAERMMYKVKLPDYGKIHDGFLYIETTVNKRKILLKLKIDSIVKLPK